MDALTNWLIDFVSRGDSALGLLALAGSAAIEYVFPPFPGDTITLLGAVLITAHGWSFWGVFGAVMAGSTAGAMAAFYLGLHLRKKRASGGVSATRTRAAIDRLVRKFERHGAWYLVVNRFLPGIRSLFFVAAGMAGLRARSVALYSTLSAALWNLGLVAVGSAFGASFDTMLSWVQTYSTAAWVLMGAVAAAVIARAVIRRRRERRERRARAEDSGEGEAGSETGVEAEAGGEASGEAETSGESETGGEAEAGGETGGKTGEG